MKFHISRNYRPKSNLFALLFGDPGSGKTLTALEWALELTDNNPDRILVVDVDSSRTESYLPSGPDANDGIPFQSVSIANHYSVNYLIDVLSVAAQEQFEVVIVDKVTPFWSGPGGLLSRNVAYADEMYRQRGRDSGNTHAAWARTGEDERALYDAFRNYVSGAGHLILIADQKDATAEGGIDPIGLRADFRANLGKEVDLIMHQHTNVLPFLPQPERVKPNKSGSVEKMLSESADVSGEMHHLRVIKSTLTRLSVDNDKIDKSPILRVGDVVTAPGRDVARMIKDHLSSSNAPSVVDRISQSLARSKFPEINDLDTLDRDALVALWRKLATFSASNQDPQIPNWAVKSLQSQVERIGRTRQDQQEVAA